MIDIKSNIDHLDALAAQYLADDLTETGKDIRAAAADLKNLRDYAIQLERNVSEMLAEVQTLNDSDGRSLANELERFIAEEVRDLVRSMIYDGEIVVTVDHSNSELELSLEV